MKFSIVEEKIIELWHKIQQSQLFINLEGQLNQFDPRIQMITLSIIGTLSVFIILSPVLFLMSSVSTKKEELQEVREMSDYLSQGAEEISQLNTIIRKKGRNRKKGINPDASLKEVMEISFKNARIIKERYSITGGFGSTAQSTLKLISLPQLLSALYNIEKNGIDILTLDVDTKNDPKGYIWAKIEAKKPIEKLNKVKKRKKNTRR